MGRILETIIPPGGWSYVQEMPGGGTMTITGSSLSDLFHKVVRERLNADISVAGVEQDVEDQICGRSSPGQCRKKKSEIRPPGAEIRTRKITPLIERMSYWIDAIHKSRERALVYPEVAAKRAKICSSCPQNVRWKTPCIACNTKIDQQLFMLRMGKDLPRLTKIEGRGCRLLSCCNRSSIWMDYEKMGTELKPSSKLPAHCWMKPFIKPETKEEDAN